MWILPGVLVRDSVVVPKCPQSSRDSRSVVVRLSKATTVIVRQVSVDHQL
jgi:hypothetical protein